MVCSVSTCEPCIYHSDCLKKVMNVAALPSLSLTCCLGGRAACVTVFAWGGSRHVVLALRATSRVLKPLIALVTGAVLTVICAPSFVYHLALQFIAGGSKGTARQ